MKRTNLLYLITYLLGIGGSFNAFGSVLPYSSTLGDEAVRQQVKEDLGAVVRSALLDHPAELQGVAVDRIKVRVAPEISFDDEEGFLLHRAEVHISLPEGTIDPAVGGATIRQFVGEALIKDDLAFADTAQPAAFSISLGSYRPQPKLVQPLRKWSIALGIASGVLLLIGLGLNFFRRKPKDKPAGRTIVQIADAEVDGHRDSTDQAIRLRENTDAAEKIAMETSAAISEPQPQIAANHASWRSGEELPTGSREALRALALMPLDEAIDVLTRFDQKDRQSIIEHLPLHPALKLRLRKGMAVDNSATIQ